MTSTADQLSYSVRSMVILRYFGQLSIVIAVLNLVPAVTALLTGAVLSAIAFATVAALTGMIGWKFSRTVAPQQLQMNEAIVISCATFLFGSLTMTWPLMTLGLPFQDALFESISGVTTTGLSTLGTVEQRPVAFLFARAWMQWYGGLGIVVFSVALMTHSGIAARSLAIADSSDVGSLGGVKWYARRVLLAYVALTLCGIASILLCGANFRNAILYTLAAVSTGGFSPHDDSLHGLGGRLVQTVVSIICVGGAIPLSIYYLAYRDGWRTFVREKQLHAMLIATSVFSVLLFFCLQTEADRSLSQNIWGALLLGASAQTTTGFEALNVATLDNASKVVLLWPMLIGGGIGSSAGGVKLVRFLILVQLLRTAVARASVPRHAVLKPHLFGHPLNDKEITDACNIVFAYGILISTSWLAFVMWGYDPLNSLLEVVSACGTVGLSAGVTSHDLPVALKLVLCVDMLMGRLEIFAWLVALNRRTWFFS